MEQAVSLRQLADRMSLIEKEIRAIKRELEELCLGKSTPWADKDEGRNWFESLFRTLSIRGGPIGVEVLQKEMERAGLTPNELSRAIVEAREE